MLDTVANARNTPDTQQPWAALGLKADEYASIRELLGRRPTGCELAMYSVMWSEHCSYKSSKKHLRRFGELSPQTPRGPLLAGIGEQAGVVDIGDGWAVTFKVESHNHPSYVEPYQGAATGVGGIVRDILAMGARPIGVMDSLRFGPLDAPDTARVLPGIVAGVGGYGNCLGLPNIGGEVVFHESYYGNPLVNALCVGVLRHEDLHLAFATGTGNKVVLYGAATGGDGIGGASILASETFTADGPAKRPSVQVGDPFMEKLLIECTLELFAAGLIVGIQDLGAAGLSCATSELAASGSGGMHVDLDVVPLRDPTLAPEEILMSESQERMMAVVAPGDVAAFLGVCAKWDVQATVIGEVTDGDRLVIDWRGQTVVDVDPSTVAHDGPVYDRPIARPAWLDALNADAAERLPRPGGVAGVEHRHARGCDRAERRPSSLETPKATEQPDRGGIQTGGNGSCDHTQDDVSSRSLGDALAADLLAVVSSANQADKSWVTDQYDRYVRGNTVLAQPQDAGVLRVDERTGLGVALAVDCNARFALLDPYAGAQLALAEAYRNVAATGATPVAVTDCLNFGSPEDPEVMWQFERAVAGLVDACRALGTPVTGGNVSFYNRTGDANIMPTPLVGMLGVIDDVADRVPLGFRAAGDVVLLLGRTREDLSGSAWAEVVHGHLGGRPPTVDFAHEARLAGVLATAAATRLLASAHDLSDGGLAQAVVECALHGSVSGGGTGVALTLPDGDPCVELFAETPGRVLVSVAPSNVECVVALAAASDVPCARLGEVTDDGRLDVRGLFTLGLDVIRARWTSPIPAAMG